MSQELRAIYGSNFNEPVSRDTRAIAAINDLACTNGMASLSYMRNADVARTLNCQSSIIEGVLNESEKILAPLRVEFT